MDLARVVALARILLEVPHDAYREAVAEQLRGLTDADDVFWMQTDFCAGTFTMWRWSLSADDRAAEAAAPRLLEHPAIQSYLRDPTDVSPRRTSDLPAPQREAEVEAARLADELIGSAQLSLIMEVTGTAGGHGWVLTRDGGDFGDQHLETARQVMPALLIVDHVRSGSTAAPTVGPDPGHVDASSARHRWQDLTSRERQVIDLVASGLTARAIGRLLGISSRTVGKHLENSYQKLGWHDRLTVAVELRALNRAGVVPRA